MANLFCLSDEPGGRDRSVHAEDADRARDGQTTISRRQAAEPPAQQRGPAGAQGIHPLAAVLGRPAVTPLTPGNANDVRTAPDVLASAAGRLTRRIAERGYDADHLCRNLRKAGTIPIIPGMWPRKRPIRRDERCDHWVARRLPHKFLKKRGWFPRMVSTDGLAS